MGSIAGARRGYPGSSDVQCGQRTALMLMALAQNGQSRVVGSAGAGSFVFCKSRRRFSRAVRV